MPSERVLDLGAPVEHVAQQVNAVPVDQAFLDRLKEFDLLVGVNAVPVVDDDVGTTGEGRLVDFAPRSRNV